MSDSENIDPASATSILPTTINHEQILYPALPALPPLSPIHQNFSPIPNLPSPWLSGKPTIPSPANISRRRVPLRQCLSHSPARPGHSARVQSVFNSATAAANQSAKKSLAKAEALLDFTNATTSDEESSVLEMHVNRSAAQAHIGRKTSSSSPAASSDDSADASPRKVLSFNSSPAVASTRAWAVQHSAQPPSQQQPHQHHGPAASPFRLQAKTTIASIRTLAQSTSLHSPTPNKSRPQHHLLTSSIIKRPRSTRKSHNKPAPSSDSSTSSDETSSSEQEGDLERAIAASLPQTPTRHERRRALNLDPYLRRTPKQQQEQQQRRPESQQAINRAISSEDWTDDEIFFPAHSGTTARDGAVIGAGKPLPSGKLQLRQQEEETTPQEDLKASVDEDGGDDDTPIPAIATATPRRAAAVASRFRPPQVRCGRDVFASRSTASRKGFCDSVVDYGDEMEYF